MSSSMRSRPRTPPGPPPPSSSSGHRKSSKSSSSRSHGAPSSTRSGTTSSRSSGSKMLPPHTDSDLYAYSSKPGKLSKSSYPLSSSKSSVSRENEKYSKSSSVRKSSGKISSSDKYALSKNEPYLDDYKSKVVSSTKIYGSDPYLEKDVYASSRYPSESKGIRSYPDKYGSVPDPYNDVSYSSASKTKYYDSYSSYSGVTSHYPPLDSGGPYYSGGNSSGYGGYGAPYDEPRMAPAPRSYGGDKIGPGGGRLLHPQYAVDEPRNYRDYSSSIHSARSPLDSRGGSRYNDYGHYSPPPETSDRLSRYVIGDSVVYGDKEYCPDLGQASPKRRRPPSPPTQLPPIKYSRYSDGSPRRGYGSSSKGRSPLSGVPHTPPYRSLSPLNRRPPSPLRRPPSPPHPPSSSRRPLSPDSSYTRAAPVRSSQVSHERSRVKDSFKNRSKNHIPAAPHTPPREPAHTDRHRSDGKLPKEKERKRDLDKRSRDKDRNSKHPRRSSSQGDRKSLPRKKDSQGAISMSKNRLDSRDVKRARSPIMHNGREGSSRDRKDSTGREKDKPRRIEDRLGPNPNSVGNRRRAPVKGRVTRRPNSPNRDKKKGRRPDDLRLWIESRKNEVGGKRPASPNRSRLPAAKRLGRAGDRNAQVGNRRPRIDPKKRLGNKARRKGGLLNTRRNKILKKYGKLNAAKRGGNGDNNAKNRNDGYKGKNGNSGGGNRRIINKPKHISRVNLLPVKPRVIKKTTSKLLPDLKEQENRKYEEPQSSQASQESAPKEEKPSTANTDVSTGNSK